MHAGAAFAGSLQPHGRLDPPMLMALDEVTQICPVPLPLWMADSAGKGILIVAVCHGLAQLEARWDKAGARAIWDTAGIKVILGGVSDPDTLDRLSRLCGEIALRTHSRTRTEDGRRAHTRHLPARPGAATRTAADPARMARPGPAHQPVPGHRPAPDGLAPTRLPPRPPDRPSTAQRRPLHIRRRPSYRHRPAWPMTQAAAGSEARHPDEPEPGRARRRRWPHRRLCHSPPAGEDRIPRDAPPLLATARRDATPPAPALGSARRLGDDR